jgi:DNA-binding CsgD family transcriptional regulator
MAVRGAAVLADAAAAGPDAGAPAALAVPPLVATGSVDRARALVEPGSGAGGGGTSSMLRSAVELTAAGVLASVGPAPGTALSSLIRAASLMEPIGSAVLLPDTPSALAALVAVHGGELDVADSVLRRAVAAGTGGRAMAARHRLLQAWIAMTRGDAAGARELAAAATPVSGVFEPRDELFAAALEVGIARRVGDSAGLRTAWDRAREALVRHPVDLFVLQPLGELTVGAARLREGGAVRAAWAEAEALLAGLGDPPLWRLTTSWHGLAAAVTAEDVPAAERHGALLEELAGTGPFATALATAARTWLRALAGDIVPTEVEAAARGLHRLGWAWDGARLAGEAAIRTADRRAMATLLACARSLSDNGRPGTDGAPVGLPTSGLPGDTGEVSLSDREREVAQLVLAGLTHKQIGARLYISSKTVEHHVARMRQRLGSGSRGELFAHLRRIVGSGSD